MTQFETYSLLFVDSFVTNLVIGSGHELILHTMKMFGYNNLIMLLVAVWASTTANIINYIFGKILLNIFFYSKHAQELIRHRNIAKFYFKYDIILLFLMLFPVASIFVGLIAGFFKTHFFKFLAVGCLAKACYYAFVIYL